MRHPARFWKCLALAVCGYLPLAGIVEAQTWSNPAGGNWEVGGGGGNWGGAPFPDMPSATAAFMPLGGGLPRTINSAAGPGWGFIVGRLLFNESTSGAIGYRLTNNYSLILDSGGSGTSQIRFMPGNRSDHQIDTDLYLNENTLFIADSSNTPGTKYLYLNGDIRDWTGGPPTDFSGIAVPVNPTTHNLVFTGNAAGPFVAQLSGNNTFTGSTTINSQVTVDIHNPNALGNPFNQTRVNQGGTLQISNTSGTFWFIQQSNVTISGGGAPGTGGALYNAAGFSFLDVNTLYVEDDTTIRVVSGTELNVYNSANAPTFQSIVKMSNSTSSPVTLTLDVEAPIGGLGGMLDINGHLYQATAGTINLSKTGDGIARISGYNSTLPKYNGSLTVHAGMLQSVVSEDQVSPGSFGESALGTSGGNTLVLPGATLSFHNTTGSFYNYVEDNVRIYGNGYMGYGAIHNDSGYNQLDVSGGLLHVASDSRISTESGSGLGIVGQIMLDGDLTLDTWGFSDQFIYADVMNGSSGPHGLIKTGPGFAYLSGNNTFDGAVRVEDGVLYALTNQALGNPTGGVYGTTVLTGATLELQGWPGVTIKGEELHLAGIGSSVAGVYGGALRSGGGNNAWLGNIYLDDDARISSAVAGDSLTLLGGKPILDLQKWDVTFHGSGDIYVDGRIIGAGGVFKEGPGTTIFGITPGGGASLANTYKGDTVINNGTLVLKKDAGVDAIANGTITVNSTGTLLLGNKDQINDGVKMVLNGGTFNTGGTSDTLDTLTLTSNSVIDLDAGSSILHFADSSSSFWSGTLDIWNYSGTPNVGLGTDQVYFGNSGLSNGLTGGQLSQINFYSDNGLTLLGTAIWAANPDEITYSAIPEPATIFSALVLLGGLAWRERRRLTTLWCHGMNPNESLAA